MALTGSTGRLNSGDRSAVRARDGDRASRPLFRARGGSRRSADAARTCSSASPGDRQSQSHPASCGHEGRHIQATPGNPITIRLSTLDPQSGLPGPAGGFDADSTYTWWAVGTFSSINGFNPAAVVIDASGFANPHSNRFSVSADNSGLYLHYAADPSAVGAGRPVPRVLAFHPALPNPVRTTTLLRFDLPRRTRVDLGIYTVAGQLVRSLVSEELPPGAHSVVWDGRTDGGERVGASIYLARMATAEGLLTKKVTVL